MKKSTPQTTALPEAGKNNRGLKQLEKEIKTYKLTDPKLLKISQRLARQMLKIAEQTLKDRRDDPEIQVLCVKRSIELINSQQDRIDPKKNVSVNASVEIMPVDLSKFLNRNYATNDSGQSDKPVIDIHQTGDTPPTHKLEHGN